MYKSFFKLESSPFSLSPDPSFLYRSPQHEEALANLIYGVQNRRGFIMLTGEVGTGKTTLLECLRDYLDEHHTPFGFLFNSRLNPQQFFEMLAWDFGLQCNRSSKTEVLFSLNQVLLERANDGVTTALIIDEGQCLEWDVLEEIRMLGNLENRKGKLIQVILAGQPELEDKLNDPNYRQLKQRIALRCHLKPLTAEQTGEYVATRLEKAGLPNQEIFTPELLEEIHRRTGGIPRVINLACDNLLLTAFAAGAHVATMEMLDEVSRDMELKWPGSSRLVGMA